MFGNLFKKPEPIAYKTLGNTQIKWVGENKKTIKQISVTFYASPCGERRVKYNGNETWDSFDRKYYSPQDHPYYSKIIVPFKEKAFPFDVDDIEDLHDRIHKLCHGTDRVRTIVKDKVYPDDAYPIRKNELKDNMKVLAKNER